MFSTEIRGIVLFSGEKWRDEVGGWRDGGIERWKGFWRCGNFLQNESGELLSLIEFYFTYSVMFFVSLSMEITDVRSGMKKAIIIREVTEDDFKILSKRRFSFTWRAFKKSTVIYKLQIDGEEDILGVMGLIDLPDEKRIEIKLLACSLENIGKEKRYDGIAGCLIAFACRQAVIKYQDYACISLVPKTVLTRHYIKKYYMQSAGRQLYLEGNSLLKILREYI